MIQLSPSCAVVMKALPPSQETGISHKLVMERCDVLGQKEGTSSAALSKLSKMGYAVKHQDLWTRSTLGESMMKNLKDIPIEEVEKALELSPESLAAVNGDCDVDNICKVAVEESKKTMDMVQTACDPEAIKPILDRMNENYRKICEGEPVKNDPESLGDILDHIKSTPVSPAPWEADLRHVIDKIKYHEIPPDAINAYGLMVEAMPESVKRVLQPITDWVLRQDKV